MKVQVGPFVGYWRGDSSELSEGEGGTFDGLTRLNKTTSHELLVCTHSKAYNFKEERP